MRDFFMAQRKSILTHVFHFYNKNKFKLFKEYTFLKRPVLIFEDQIFIGNTAKVVMAAKTAIHGK
jgi:hypothetical protein